MQRYGKIVLEAEKGITFDVSEGTSGELIIRALNIVSNNVYSELPTVSAGEYAEVLSVYTDNNGNRAVVPEGWTVSGVPKENIIWGIDVGLVIYHIPKEKVSGINWQDSDEVETLMRTYDQFVWTPVGLLTANGTLDGIHFNEKFGRMNYRNATFSKSAFHEPLVGELLSQKESVDKYGGYYSSRYDISKDKETGKPRSVKGADSWTNIDFLTAKEVASTMVKSKTVTSHLMYGAEYDTREKWVIESGTVTTKEIAEDSTELGNYYNNKNYPSRIVKTGEDGCINNIYGFAGNVDEWTQEWNSSSCRVIRGGCCNYGGNYCPVAFRIFFSPNDGYGCTGFRATLYIK
ncbi:MAG: hypothetical protein HFJ37_05905 [Clostridia bacterium]|nr:hypothetical protein [Clostridia bacterium]